MRRDKKRKTLQNTLSSVDSVLAALNAYPNLEDALLERAQSEMNKYLGKLFPTQLDFSKEILEHLVGTDVMIEIISKFLTYALPGVEVSLKAALLANMQNLGTNCTIDPIIYEKAIKEGVLFDLKQIDLIDKLSISPLDKKLGQYYYFGIEGCESSYDVLQSAIDPNNQSDNSKKTNGVKEGTSYLNRAMNDSVGHYFGGRKRDFDCLLWYMKNKAIYREVWGKRTSLSEDIFNGNGDIQTWISKKGDKNTRYYEIKNNSVKFYEKEPFDEHSGNLVSMSEDKKYPFWEGGKKYEYVYGNAPIKKLSRKKHYYSRAHGVFYFNNGNWLQVPLSSNTSFKNTNELFDFLDETKAYNTLPLFYLVDRSVYALTEAPKLKDEKITYIKSDECVDITNDLVNNLCVFVDYDLDGNKEKIKRGEDVKSSFSPTNTGEKQWFKRAIEKGDNESPSQNDDVFYVKKSNGDFDSNVDKILISPYIIKNNKAIQCVNINSKMEKDNKYTKDFGVLTVDFSPRAGNILQSDGDPMQQQTPYDNVLHVFFGNTKELHTSERDKLQEDWKDSSNVNKNGSSSCKLMESMIELNYKFWKEKEKDKKNLGLESYYYGTTLRDVSDLFDWVNYKYILMLDGPDGIKSVSEKDKNIKSSLDVKSGYYEDLNKLNSKINDICECINGWRNNIYVKNGFDFQSCKDFINEMIGENGILKDGDTIYTIRAYAKRISQIMEANENLVYLSAKNLQYPEAKKNYYYLRTLYEFNADYINSLQLFDSKVLAAQLITSLFGGLTLSAMIGATASWKTELIRDTVKDMIEKIIASEDTAVSDCFFTFTNDSYNNMLRASELRQAGLYSKHGEENGNSRINPLTLLEGLNGIDEAADQAGQTEIIKGAINNAAVEISRDTYREDNHLAINADFGIKMSFIEMLMINLCTQCVMAMLSPKVYLLILINLQMFGLSTNFDLKAFLERFSNLIRSIVKSVVDQFMQYLIEEIMKILEELLQKLIVKISFEQVEMYTRLLKQILMHLRMLLGRFKGQNVGWAQDIVGYADITPSDNEEPINEC